MSLSVFIFYLNSFTLYGVFFAVMSLASMFSYIIMCSVPAYVAVIFGVIGIFGMRNAWEQFNNDLIKPIGMRNTIYPLICSIYFISFVSDNVNTSCLAGFIQHH